MNLTRPALGNPVAVIVAVLLVLLFGVISLLRMPVQMIPNVERPLIEISTTWRAAAPEDGDISYRSTADDKDRAIANMARSLVLAIVILYRLMSVLFRSFRDSLLVIVALPMAMVGGVVTLRITGMLTFQPMDLLTMIGFITLMGLVVNNAILLVAQRGA